jgi:Mechanosensitive ion channel, conserved TM helix
MWNQVERILTEAADRVTESVAAFMPGVLALLTILLAALVVATLARLIVVRMLRSLDFDRRMAQWGLGAFGDWSQTKGMSAFVGRAAYWTILILGLLTGLTALDAAIPSEFALSMFRYVPHLLAALIVLVVGSILAQFLSRAVLIGAVNMQIQSARALSLGVRWILLIVAASMALEQLGIGRQILLLAFGILFGGVVLATALAVGLGAKDVVNRALAQQLQQQSEKIGNHLDHV